MRRIEFVPSTEDDYLFVHDLHRENMISYIDQYWGGWNSEIFQRDFNPSSTWIILFDGKKAGFFVLHQSKKAHIANIQILPDYQMKGIGSRILNHCESISIKNGFNGLYLEVFITNPAKALYERYGFETYEETESHFKMMKLLAV